MNFLVNVMDTGHLTQEFLENLKELKKQKIKKNLPISTFVSKLRELFQIDKLVSLNTNYQMFLGGFILGEGSLNLSLKKKSDLIFGVSLDLEFSVTQSYFGVSHLINLIDLFNAGNLSYKSSSAGTFVFDIGCRKTIFEKVFPFWEKYILPYQTHFEAEQRFYKFKELKTLFDNKAHQNKEAFLNELLPLWDSLRKQKGQSNEAFKSLVDAQEYVENHLLLRNK